MEPPSHSALAATPNSSIAPSATSDAVRASARPGLRPDATAITIGIVATATASAANVTLKSTAALSRSPAAEAANHATLPRRATSSIAQTTSRAPMIST